MRDANSTLYIGLDGKPIADQSDWEYVRALSDKDAMRAALADPDAQPRPESAPKQGRRLGELPGNTLIEKLRALKDANEPHYSSPSMRM